jgi:hypothetical protein
VAARSGRNSPWSSNAKRKRPAAADAARIGGDPYQHAPGERDPLEYVEEDDLPAGQTADSWRAVEEGGGGESEGFEEAEAELVERAEKPSRTVAAGRRGGRRRGRGRARLRVR